jgi:O-antigen ligase
VLIAILILLLVVVAPLSPSLGLGALITWVLLSGLLTPVVHLRLTVGTISFDDVWFSAVLVMLALSRFPRSAAKIRRAIGLLWLFGAEWVIRTLLSSGLTLSNRLAELAAVALPAAAFLVAFRYARDERGRVRLTGAMTVTGGILALLGIAESTLGFQLATYSGGLPRVDPELGGVIRISGPYADPEVYGVTLLICLAATLHWGLADRGRPKMLAILIAGVECTAIGLTLFRTFWIAALVTVVIVFGWRRGQQGRLVLICIGILGVIGITYSQISSTTFGQVRVANTTNITGRFDIYDVALQEFERAPLIGVGVGQFVPYQQNLPPTDALLNSRGVVNAHDSFTQVLAEQGLVGFVPLLLACAALLRIVVLLIRRARTWPDYLLALVTLSAAVSFLLSNLTLEMLTFGQSTAMFAAMFGAAAGRLDALLQGEREILDEQFGQATTPGPLVPLTK